MKIAILNACSNDSWDIQSDEYEELLNKNYDYWSFLGDEKLHEWISPKFYIAHPNKKPCDFLHFPSTFAISIRALEVTADIFERHGEFLPIKLHGEEYFFYNCTNVFNCIDEVACRHDLPFPERRKLQIKKKIPQYWFKTKRLGDIYTFKIPGNSSLIFSVLDGSEYDLSLRVKKHKLTGLKFDIVQESDN